MKLKNYRPSYGDVVMGKFPFDYDRPGKLRPCVVVGSCPRSGALDVVYTTSLGNGSNTGGIEVSSISEMRAAGFHGETRIVPSRRAVIPKSHTHIDVSSVKSYVPIGRLSKETREELRKQLENNWHFAFLNGETPDQFYPAILALTAGWISNVRGASMKADAPCPTLEFGGDVSIEFWPEDPDSPDRVLGADIVTADMIKGDMLITGTDKLRCLAFLEGRNRKAS